MNVLHSDCNVTGSVTTHKRDSLSPLTESGFMGGYNTPGTVVRHNTSMSVMK